MKFVIHCTQIDTLEDNEMLPIMTDLGLFLPDGHAWLISDGEFPFDACDDRTSSPVIRASIVAGWNRRKALYAAADSARRRLGMSWAEYYRDSV